MSKSSSNKTIKVRLTTGGHGRREESGLVIYKPGDTLLVTQAEYDNHKSKMEVIDKLEVADVVKGQETTTVDSSSYSDEPDIVDKDIGTDDDPLTPADHYMTAKKQVEALTDITAARAFLKAEKDNRARDSVLEAAEARILALGG